MMIKSRITLINEKMMSCVAMRNVKYWLVRDRSRDCRVRTPRYIAIRRIIIGRSSEKANVIRGGSTPVNIANETE